MSVYQAVAATDLRVVWESPDHAYRLVARVWPDGHAATYTAMVQRHNSWQWCGDSREEQAVLRAVAAWMDGQQRKQAEQDAALRRMTALADESGHYD